MSEFPWNYIWVAANLALIVFVVRRLLGRPLGTLLAGRRQGIIDRFDQAGEATVSAARMREQASGRLDGVGREKQAMLDRARERMQVLSGEARRASEDEAARILERTRSGVTRERDLAVKELWQRASHRTVDATRAVLAQAAGPGDDERLIRELLAGLKEVDL